MFEVEVAYALADRQKILRFAVTEGCTAVQAIRQSGILLEFPEIDLASVKIGVFSQAVTLDTVLRAGDRVEIYRPLTLDPKQARFKRVAQQQNKA